MSINSKHVDNKTRNFNVGNEESYPICDSGCSFNITELEKKDFIEGLKLHATSNLLHINPLVNVNELQLNNRDTKINLNYSFKQHGDSQKYSLVDIFFRTPCKSVIHGKRYEMETCLVFNSNNKKLFVVICIPNKVSPVNNTDIDDEKDLFIFLNKIASNFKSEKITKNKSEKITDISNWNPLMFFPPKKGTNASFYTWLDPTTNDTVMYIQFEKPRTIPYNFFRYFADTLSGGTDSVNERAKLQANPINDKLEVYYNINENITPVITRRVCKTETNKEVQSFLSERKPVDSTDKESGDNKPNVSNKKNKSNIFKYIILSLIGILFLLLFLIYGFYLYKKYKLKTIKLNNLYLGLTSILELILITIIIYNRNIIKILNNSSLLELILYIILLGILIAVVLFLTIYFF